jgi:hypothetical protein
VNPTLEVEQVEPDVLDYEPGPTAARFHQNNDFVRGLMGPVGTGKSVTCVLEMFMRAINQRPYKGVRRTRFAAVRNTYPELKSTTIKTFQDWFPQHIAPIKWDVPITARLIMPLEDGTTLDMEVLFLALDRPQDVKKLKSLELTALWMNEASEMDKSVLEMGTSRVGRFPGKRMGGPSWRGVWLDTNPPDDDHWYYHLAEEEQPCTVLPDGSEVKFSFFRIPPALLPHPSRADEYIPNPDAENIANIEGGYAYWYQQLPGKTREWIKVFVMGHYGTVHDGRPVYPEWREEIHLSQTIIEPMRGLPLLLGWDFGLTPAVVITQLTPTGQLRVLDELCSDGMGIKQFTRDAVKPFLANKYGNMAIRAWGDPAGREGAQNDKEATCYKELYAAGLAASPARSNDFLTRREGVVEFLTRLSDGQPGLLVSPTCKMLRKGFNGGYKRARIQVTGGMNDVRYRDEPVKNEYSHPHDALQYVCMEVNAPRKVLSHAKRRPVRAARASGWT